MRKYTRCREERETTINFDESCGIATVYSCSQTVLKKLMALAEKYPDTVKAIWTEPTHRITPVAMKYEIPVSSIKFKGPRQMSDKQRAALDALHDRQRQSSQNQF